MKSRLALIAFAALALAAAPLIAQDAPGGRQGRGQGRGRAVSLATLPVNTLETILKLTADQKSKVTTIQEKYRTDSQALRPAQGQPVDPANRAKLGELTTQANKDIEAVLTDEQKTKWTDARKELTLFTAAGIPPALYGELKLTAEQKTKLGAIRKETTEKLRTAQPDERRTINQDARQKAADVLTAEQKSAIEKYNKEHPRRGGRQQPS